jgi:VanZ family protein
MNWQRAWILAGCLAVVFVTIMSLIPGQQLPSIGISDKIEHLVAYGGTTLLFAISRMRWRALLFTAAALAAWGAIIEVLQPILSNRTFDWFDMAANTFGLLLALTLTAIARRTAPRPA